MLSEIAVRPFTGPSGWLESRPTCRPEVETRCVTAEPAPLQILVVDDDLVGSRLLSRLLQSCGHRLTVAHDGLEALVRADADVPDVVLLDIGLPGIDGYEVARRLRMLDGPTPVLLIALTGHGREDDFRRTRASGFDHHLVKPLDPDALMTLLDNYHDRVARLAS